jgi:hypothetical protein
MAVQYRAVFPKGILHIVLNCLTPAESGRYSKVNLCPPRPAWGENVAHTCVRSTGEGIQCDVGTFLVNRPYFQFRRQERARQGTHVTSIWALKVNIPALSRLRQRRGTQSIGHSS